MVRLAGAALLMAGAAGAGLRAAGELRRRVEALHSLIGALEQAERELSFRLAPMPELLEHLARQTGEPARSLFAHCRDHLGELGEKSFGELWREALEGSGLPLGDRERELLAELGEVLGRYGAPDQRAALQAAAAELEGCLRRAEADRDRLGRVYTALGVSSGAMLVILLL